MSEQMFNIAAQFSVKLVLPLGLYGWEALSDFSVSLGYAFIYSLCALCGLAVQCFVISAAVPILPAGQCQLRRSSAIFPYYRRLCATTVAVPELPAACCGAKFAIQRRISYLAPFISATMWRIFANRLLSRSLMK
jgi:hypothetical protein